MSDFDVTSLISGGMQAAGSLAAAGLSYKGVQDTNALQGEIHNQNMAFQREQQEYQRNLQREMFMREDTARQRGAADMKAAGLNPVLAAGAPAQAGPVVPTQAIRNDMKFENPWNQASQNIGALGSILPNMLQMEATKASIDRTQAEAERIRAETNKISEQTPIQTEAMKLANLISGNTLTIQQQEITAKKLENQFNQSTLTTRIDNINLANKKYSSELVSMAIDQAYKKAMTVYLGYQQEQTIAQTENTRAQLANIKAENVQIKQYTATSRMQELATQTRRGIEQSLGSYQITAAEKENLIKAQQLELLMTDNKMAKLVYDGWKSSGFSPAVIAIINSVFGGIKAIK